VAAEAGVSSWATPTAGRLRLPAGKHSEATATLARWGRRVRRGAAAEEAEEEAVEEEKEEAEEEEPAVEAEEEEEEEEELAAGAAAEEEEEELAGRSSVARTSPRCPRFFSRTTAPSRTSPRRGPRSTIRSTTASSFSHRPSSTSCWYGHFSRYFAEERQAAGLLTLSWCLVCFGVRLWSTY
jgi:hypothetical protein